MIAFMKDILILMALMALLKVFPEDIVKHIEVYYTGLVVIDRLEKGWEAVHSEMSWRSNHTYFCCIHFCNTCECNCYTEYPGYLLRRVDANEWIPGSILRCENTRQYALLSAVIRNDDDEYDDLILNVEGANTTTEHPNNGAWWIDHTLNEVGSMNSMLPIVNIGYDAY